jgi:hypothetical protein
MKYRAAIPNLQESRRFLFFAALLIFAMIVICPHNLAADDMVFRQVVFKKASIRKVIGFLRKHLDINFVLRLNKAQEQKLPLISFNFRYVPPAVIIKYACLASGLNYYYNNGVLIIGKNLKIPFKYYPSDFKNRSILADIPIGSAISLGTTYWVPFPVGQPQVVNNSNTVSVVSAPVKWVPFEGRMSLGNVNKPQKISRKRKSLGRPKQPVGIVIASNSFLMRRRLERIIIPKLELDEKPLPEVIEILRKLSIKYDPTHHGINFFLLPFPGMDKATVTVTLGRMSMDKIVRLVFASGGINPILGHYVVVGSKSGLPRNR